MLYPKHEQILTNTYDFLFSINTVNRDHTEIGLFYHWHERLEIYYVINGEITLLHMGKTYKIKKGEIAFVNWCVPHQGLAFSDNTVFYNIQADISLATPFSEVFKDRYFENWHFRNNSELHYILDCLVDIWFNAKNYELLKATGKMCEALQFILEANENSVPDNKKSTSNLFKIKPAIDYIHSHLSEKLTLKEIAVLMNISESHLCRIFKKNSGISVLEYIRFERLCLARKLISEGIILQKASEAAGFEDYNYFSRSFKKQFSVSPSYFLLNNSHKS